MTASTEMADLPPHLDLFLDTYLPEPLTLDPNLYEIYYQNERGRTHRDVLPEPALDLLPERESGMATASQGIDMPCFL